MLNQITDKSAELYNNTFGQMNGPQILWTIIALLVLLQLMRIRRSLARQLHLQRIQLRGRNHPAMSRGLSTFARRRTPHEVTQMLGSVALGNGLSKPDAGRPDLSKVSPFEAYQTSQDHPGVPAEYIIPEQNMSRKDI